MYLLPSFAQILQLMASGLPPNCTHCERREGSVSSVDSLLVEVLQTDHPLFDSIHYVGDEDIPIYSPCKFHEMLNSLLGHWNARNVMKLFEEGLLRWVEVNAK